MLVSTNNLNRIFNLTELATEDLNYKRPPLFWAFTEAYRALFEFATYIPYKFVNRIPKNGDGHPVLILPGFMASDSSTVPLRGFVHQLGYNVYGWGAGRNNANEAYLEMLTDKVDIIFEKNQQPISIIGWSLGGVFARQLAKVRPHKIRQVITLGSPFKDVIRANNAKWMYDLINRDKESQTVTQALLDDLPNPAPVPTTAIYSKQDGVVPWQLCMEQQENAIHQNIEVRGSHLGLGVNLTVLQIIADRLQYSEENWCHFEPSNLVEDLLFYPSL